VHRPASAQDFFFALMRESQGDRTDQLDARDRWIRTLHIVGREEVLFELDMLLRGVERFFDMRPLFGEQGPPQDHDFGDELRAARDALHRGVHLSRRLMVQKHEQAMLFRSFVEGAVADERARERLGAEMRGQRTPEESLFLLRGGLVAHRGILDHLLSVEGAPQSLFLDVGRALRHELFASRYFCPPATFEFRSEYDRVGSVKLLEALRGASDEKKRRAFAVALLAAFRTLRGLRYVPAFPSPHTRRVLVVLALTRADLGALVGLLEGDLPRLCATVDGVGTAAAAGRTAAALLRRELERTPPILQEPLVDRAQLDLQRDRLGEATKAAIGILAEELDAGLSRSSLFDAIDGRLEESTRLREDLCVFRDLCLRTAGELDAPGGSTTTAGALRRFALEFRDVGYQLLRHRDRELFDRFLALLDAWGTRDATRSDRLRDDCRRFADILDRAIENVGKRAELRKVPVDHGAVQAALARFLQSR
jgi:hypothetical protein